jgi:transposase
MEHNVISIDLAKNVFQICVLDEQQKVVLNKKVKRPDLLHELRQFEPTCVVMEACYSSNPWGRRIQAVGHEVKLIAPFKVKPFVIGNKNDANDALAIAEASLRPNMRFVGVKSITQQDIQTVFRARERLIRNRTGLVNQLRGLLSEYGIVAGKQAHALRKALPGALEDAGNELTPVTRRVLQRLFRQWQFIDDEIDLANKELEGLLEQHHDYPLLKSIPGIGPVGAALVIAAVGDVSQFKNGRQLAAWMGLTPKQHASGDINRMGAISKRGNVALRKTLIHGARTVLNWSSKKNDPLSQWLNKLMATKHPCKVVVSLANKLARIIWAVLTTRKPFDVALASS